jgi:hypothetical protein
VHKTEVPDRPKLKSRQSAAAVKSVSCCSRLLPVNQIAAACLPLPSRKICIQSSSVKSCQICRDQFCAPLRCPSTNALTASGWNKRASGSVIRKTGRPPFLSRHAPTSSLQERQKPSFGCCNDSRGKTSSIALRKIYFVVGRKKPFRFNSAPWLGAAPVPECPPSNSKGAIPETCPPTA